VIIALAFVGIVLTSMCHNCKFGQKATRLPFHLSWFLGWIIGLLNCIVGLVVYILALSSVGGCDVVQKVQKDVNLFRSLKLPAMLETCVFGSGNLMFSTGVTHKLKPIFDIIDKINEVKVVTDELSVCPMVFFFKSTVIPGTELDGHEDIYRTYCGEDKSLDFC
jgi:heme/copper-type cytochrome/quinol oxidase subunit 2